MNILAFLAYSIIVTFTPGPTNVVILATVQNHGVRRGMEYSAGATLAFGILLALSAVLSDALADVMPGIRQAMGFVGAAYMLYLTYRICVAGEPVKANAVEAAGGAFRAGFFMQFINPKVVLFTLTVISNFVTPYTSSPIQVSAFVLLLTAIGCTAFLSWVLLGAVLKRLLHAYRRTVNLALALLLVYSAFVVSGIKTMFSS